ncbi:MAG: hypothetical protein ACI94Y_002894 [Maribacter sp.]|jgi:hypothetical protein
MKPFLIVLSLFVFIQCSPPQKALSTTAHFLHITLKGNVKPEKIVEDFKEKGLTTLKESSRSQPLYLAEVHLSEKDLNQLVSQLKKDERIQNVVILDKAPNNNTNSTNDGFGKSSPINK